MNMDKKTLIADLEGKFNSISLSMIELISTYYDDALITLMKKIAETIIPIRPAEPISYFLIHIYQNDEYRKQIEDENDKFFLRENFNSITNGNTSLINKLFEFKQIWGKINENHKLFIKKSVKTLVSISTLYIGIL